MHYITNDVKLTLIQKLINSSLQINESSDIDKRTQLIEQLKFLRDMEEHSVFCKEIPKQAPREGLFKVEMNT